MPRRSPAEAVKHALERLLKQRERQAAALQKTDDEIAELQAMLGIQVQTLPTGYAGGSPGSRPAMAGQRDPNAKPKKLDELLAEARANPIGESKQERPPFVPHEERAGAPELSGDGVSPADNMGAGRWM